MEKLAQIIDELTQEAASIQIQGRALRPDEIARVQAIYEALPHLREALDILTRKIESTLITYKIVSDLDGKLKAAARVACNFWNRFIIPSSSIVIRLGIFTANSLVIARAYQPYQNEGVMYGEVEFNTKYLSTYTKKQISGTIVHEIGHTLGFGWDEWDQLYDAATGEFFQESINKLAALEDMRVETDYGPGTKYSHWDEDRHDKELMTGIQDQFEYVLPVTIDIMPLLGHQIAEELPQQTDLESLLDSLAQITFTRQAEAKAHNLDHFEKTPIMENIPHDQPLTKKKSKR